MTAVSRIPAAIDGLYALASADGALPGVTVLDGPPVTAIATPSTVLIIGGAGDPGDVRAAGGDIETASLGGTYRETFDLACHIEHWEGGDDMKQARDAAFAVLNQLGVLLATSPRLGGAVTRARIVGGVEFAQARFKGDTGTAVPFSVHCQVA